MFAGCCCALFVVCFLPVVQCCSLFVVCVAHCGSLHALRCFLVSTLVCVVRCALPVVVCVKCVVRWLLFVVCCVLRWRCLFVVCFFFVRRMLYVDDCWMVLIGCCSLCAVLFVVVRWFARRCLWFVACCLSVGACCLVFIVRVLNAVFHLLVDVCCLIGAIR